MKIRDFKRRAVRHGEVMLIPIDCLPEGLETAETGNRVTVGHSETGHHHVAVCDESVLTLLRPVGADTQELYLQVSSVARIEHLKTFDRHETKTLAPGVYWVNTKQAYDYFLKRSVNVMD